MPGSLVLPLHCHAGSLCNTYPAKPHKCCLYHPQQKCTRSSNRRACAAKHTAVKFNSEQQKHVCFGLDFAFHTTKESLQVLFSLGVHTPALPTDHAPVSEMLQLSSRQSVSVRRQHCVLTQATHSYKELSCPISRMKHRGSPPVTRTALRLEIILWHILWFAVNY